MSETGTGQPPSGMRAIGGERFDALAAVGGWRGVAESVVPTAVFIAVLALRPGALAVALGASLVLSGLAFAARVVQRQGLTQVLGGAVLAVVSAAWAWHSGQASDFYASGLVINAVSLTAFLISLAVRWPVVGVLMELWRYGAAGEQEGLHWRKDPARRGHRRRYRAATALFAGMFALRLVVELPLYLAGDDSVAALGIARLVLGIPLFALTAWFAWLIVRPVHSGHDSASQQPPAAGH